MEKYKKKNPFQIQVILDVLFKLLPFEEVKKFRLVSSTWNEVGLKELSGRPQKPIKFSTIDELKDNDKLGTMVQLLRGHNEVFPSVQSQIFSNFSFYPSFLQTQQFEQFFENFSIIPNFVEFFGEVSNQETRKVLTKFLVKISSTVQEIRCSNYPKYYIKDNKVGEKGQDYAKILTSTQFPNLRKISNKYCSSRDLKELCFYSLIGQNSPKLHHLELGPITEEYLGSPGYLKEKFKQSGLMSKLQILDLYNYNERSVDKNLLKIFTEFDTNGVLKLTKLKIQYTNVSLVQIKENYTTLIASQAGNLKILEISTIHSSAGYHYPPSTDLVTFPSLENLTILKIDYFTNFEDYFEPINFTLQFPKLVEFRTCDIRTFLDKKLGQGVGGSVKFLSIFKNPSDRRKEMDYYNKLKFNIDKVVQIFPNLEVLDLDLFICLPDGPFWSQLRKVRIHCTLQDLFYFDRKYLQDAKKVEFVVDCGNKLIDVDLYKDYLGGFMRVEELDEYNSDSDYYTRHKFYEEFLTSFSQDFAPLQSVSLTFIGHNISEDFKQDIRAILTRCTFLCSPFKSSGEN